jgi:plasmid maintenance system antidote protein VapI
MPSELVEFIVVFAHSKGLKSAPQLADALNTTASRLYAIMSGNMALDGYTASKLARVLGGSVEEWQGLER